jgi:hypothetical protein
VLDLGFCFCATGALSSHAAGIRTFISPSLARYEPAAGLQPCSASRYASAGMIDLVDSASRRYETRERIFLYRIDLSACQWNLGGSLRLLRQNVTMSQRLTSACYLRCCSGLRNCQPWAKHLRGHGNSTLLCPCRNTACGHPFGTNALRISRSFAFTLTAFSRPIRTRIFWPAESSSSFGSANSYSTLG